MSQEIIEEISLNDEVCKGKKYTLFLLARKDYSQYTLLQKLKSRKLSEKSTEIILSWLKKNNYINDEAFAESLVRYRMNNKPMGRFRLNQELKTKGIQAEIREKVINEAFQGNSEKELARNLTREKIFPGKRNIEASDAKKIYHFLIRRGFSSEISKNIFFELIHGEFS